MIDYVAVSDDPVYITWSSTLQSHLSDFWLNSLLESPANSEEIPLALCFASQLAAASSAASQHADVTHPISGSKMPLSVYVTGVAESGVGKTPAYDAFVKPTMEVFNRAEAQNGDFKIKQRIWELKRKGLEKAFINAAQAGEPDDQLHAAMCDHENNKPIDNRMLYQAMSFTAFAKASSTNHKRMFIASDDAEIVLKSGQMNFPSAFCSAWDGGDKVFMVDGAYRECAFHDLILNSALFVQPKFFDPFLAKNDGAARESGLMARSLIVRCRPGQKDDGLSNEVLDQGHLRAFLARLKQLLLEIFRRRREGDYSRATLIFSPDAVVLWKEERAAINEQAKPGGKLEDISDFVAKHMDNAFRIAGIFHVVDGLEGEISSKTLSRANAVMRLFLAEFKRMFDPIDDTPKSINDAWRVVRYLYVHNWLPNNLPASYNDVLQGRAVREGCREFDAAINHLVNIGYVTADKSERKKFIRLNPTAFSQLTAKSFEGPIPESFYRAPVPCYGDPSRQGPLPFMGGLYSSQVRHQQTGDKR